MKKIILFLLIALVGNFAFAGIYDGKYKVSGLISGEESSEKVSDIVLKSQTFYPISKAYSNHFLDNKHIVSVKNTESGAVLEKDLNDYFEESYHLNTATAAWFCNEDYLDLLIKSCYLDTDDDEITLYYIVRYDFGAGQVSLLLKEKATSLFTNLFTIDKDKAAENIYRVFTENSLNLEGNYKYNNYYYGYERSIRCKVKNESITTYAALMLESSHAFFSNDVEVSSPKYKANSELQEGKTTYSASNLKKFDDYPWTSAYKTQFTKEKIIITAGENIAGLVIGNGFNRKQKEYLYTWNDRPHEIIIRYDSYGLEQHVILEDTADLQIVPLLFCNSRMIEIEIVSLYKGTRYDDVCINNINCLKDMDYKTWSKFYK